MHTFCFTVWLVTKEIYLFIYLFIYLVSSYFSAKQLYEIGPWTDPAPFNSNYTRLFQLQITHNSDCSYEMGYMVESNVCL